MQTAATTINNSKTARAYTIAEELQAQRDESARLSMVIGACFAIAGVCAYNNSNTLAFLCLCVAAFLFFAVRSSMLIRHEERQLIIVMKTQVLNIYVFSSSVQDDTVMARKDFVLASLKAADNDHGVKVWYMQYGSPFFHWYKHTSKGIEKGRHSVPTEACANYESYAQYCNAFIAKDEYDRKVELEGGTNKEATQWAGQFIYNQKQNLN